MIQPLQDYIILKVPKSDKTESGIIIPDGADMKTQNIAEVVAVSKEYESKISVGDTVYYKEMGVEEIEVEGEKYLLLKYQYITAKV